MSMMSETQVPAIEGWFTTGESPALVGARCTACGTVAFPPTGAGFCRNPGCDGDELEAAELSRTGRIWSYTDARYQPPPPYVPRRHPYEPFALAAVELEAEGIVVLGQVADGYTLDDLAIGAPVELVVEPLYAEGDTTYTVWKWRPTQEPAQEGER
jgi:uncharacterized OB-fold protein